MVLSSIHVWNKSSQSLLLVSGLQPFSVESTLRSLVVQPNRHRQLYTAANWVSSQATHHVSPATGLFPRCNTVSTFPKSLHKSYAVMFESSLRILHSVCTFTIVYPIPTSFQIHPQFPSHLISYSCLKLSDLCHGFLTCPFEIFPPVPTFGTNHLLTGGLLKKVQRMVKALMLCEPVAQWW